MADRVVGVAVLGLGNIGGAVASAIAREADALAHASGLNLQLVGALARDGSYAARLGLDPRLARADGLSLIREPEVDVVVEVLGGEQPATDLMLRALAAGKHVVTANKEAVSKHLPAILEAAHASQVGFLCEASVGGGIPLLVGLRQLLASNRIESLRGIVNGTTNFILSKMDAEGADYAATLAEAQTLGYAEPDPTADVEGFDASYKLAILASLALGRHIRPEQVERTGISGVSAGDIADAKARGGTLRLIASMQRHGADVAGLGVLAPTFVPAEDLFARVVRNFNAVEIVGDRIGAVLLHGQGAGPGPTSSAILSDIVEAVRTGVAATPRLVSSS